MNFSRILLHGCRQLEVAISDEAVVRLEIFYQELVKWNRKMNLVAQAPEQEIIESHFLDSLTLLAILDANAERSLLDVGTGAGFPGLVVKACRPDLKLTLVEPRNKRVSFLRHIVRTLRLDQIDILAKRLEPEFNAENDKKHPLITSRAVSQIHEFLDLVADHCPSGGMVVCMKGPKAQEEISLWQEKAPASPFVLTGRVQKILPYSKSIRNLILFQRQ